MAQDAFEQALARRRQRAPAQSDPFAAALARRKAKAAQPEEEPSTFAKIGADVGGALAAFGAVKRQTVADLMGLGKSEEEKRQIQSAADVFAAAQAPRNAKLRQRFETARAVTSVPLQIAKYGAVSSIPVVGLPLAATLGAAEAAGGQAETSVPAMLSRGAERAGMPRVSRALGAVAESPVGRALFDVVSGEVLSRGIQGVARTTKQVRGLGEMQVADPLGEAAARGVPRPAPPEQGQVRGLLPAPRPPRAPRVTAPAEAAEPRAPIAQPDSWRLEALRRQGAPQSLIDAIRAVEAQQAALSVGQAAARTGAPQGKRAAAKAQRAAEREAQKAADAAKAAATKAAMPRGRRAMATPEELADIPDRFAADSPVHPDGSWKLTAEELDSPQRMETLGVRRRLPSNLSSFTDRELEIATMGRMEEMSKLQETLMRGEQRYDVSGDMMSLEEMAMGLGDQFSRGNTLQGKGLTAAELRNLGAKESEDFVSALENAGISYQEYREFMRDLRAARLREATLNRQLARIDDEVKRRASGAPAPPRPATGEAPTRATRAAGETEGPWWTQSSYKKWTELNIYGKRGQQQLNRTLWENIKGLDEAGLREAASSVNARIESLWDAGKMKDVDKYLRPVQRAIDAEFDRRGLTPPDFTTPAPRATETPLQAPPQTPPPAAPPAPPQPPPSEPKIGPGGYPEDWAALALAPGFGQGGVGAAAGALGAEEGDRLENALLYGIGGAAAGVAGVRAFRALRGSGIGSAQDFRAAGRSIREATGTLSERLQRALKGGTTMPAATRRATPLTEAIDPDAFVNVPRFSDDPAVQDRIRAAAAKAVAEVDIPLRTTAADVAAGRAKSEGVLREQESFDEVRRKVADELGLDPAEIVVRAKGGKPLDRFDMLTIRNALVDATTEESEILARLNDKNSPPLAAEIDELRARYARVAGERNALFEAFSIGRTQQGRDLNALKIAARQTFDPLVWEARLTELAKRPLTESEKVTVRTAATNRDQGELFKVAQEIRKATNQEKFVALFKAGMLSAPRTYLSNVLGNTAMLTMEMAKEVPAVFFDNIAGAFTGQRTKYFDPAAMLRAGRKGAVEGAQDAMRVMRGEVPKNLQTDLPREINFDTPVLNYYTRTVFRSLSATDQFFKNMAIARSIDEQARVMARSEKLTGDAFTARVAELVQRPTDAMAGRALVDAEIATFQDSGVLAEGALMLRRGLNRITGGVGGDLLFPFVKTPANIAQRIIDYSPAGGAIQLGKIAQRTLRKGGVGADAALAQRQIVEQLGRASVGTAALYLGYALAQNGQMTGFFPRNQRERDAWEQQGKIEGAMKGSPDGPWIQVNKYSPLGNLMQIGAQMHDLEINPSVDKGEYTVGALTAPLLAVAELPMVANVSDLIDAAKAAGGPESAEALTRVAGRFTTGLIPGSGLLRSVAYGIDPYERETRGATTAQTMGQQLRASIPGVSQGLPQRVDPLGQPRERTFGLLGSLTSPSRVQADLTRQDPVRAELARTGAVVGRVERQRTESGEEYAARERVVGRAISRHLQNTMQTPEYQNIGRMDVRQARAVLAQYAAEMEGTKPIDLAKISDDRIRSRLQGMVLQQEAAKVKAAITRATQQARGTSSSRRAIEAIIR